jgi:hypothetical protein
VRVALSCFNLQVSLTNVRYILPIDLKNTQCVNGLLKWLTAGDDFVAWNSGDTLHVPTDKDTAGRRVRCLAQGNELNAHQAAFIPWNKNLNHWTLWVVRPQTKLIEHYEPLADDVEDTDKVRRESVLAYVSAMTETIVSCVVRISIRVGSMCPGRSSQTTNAPLELYDEIATDGWLGRKYGTIRGTAAAGSI